MSWISSIELEDIFKRREKMAKTIKELFEDGKILEEFGSDYFLTVSPIPAIEKCRFSVMKIGEKGKDPADFWMPFSNMITLCDEILSPTIFTAKIKADMKNQYPSAYKFVGGKDGCKKLDIGGGQKGVRVHIAVPGSDGKTDNRTLAISYNSIKNMAIYFQYIIGLKPSSFYMNDIITNTFYAQSNEWNREYDNDDVSDTASPQDTANTNTESEQKANNTNITAPKAIRMYCISEITQTNRGFEFGCKVCNKDMTQGQNIYTVCIKKDADISKEQFIRLRDTIKEKLNRDDPRPPMIQFEFTKDDEAGVTYLNKLITNADDENVA